MGVDSVRSLGRAGHGGRPDAAALPALVTSFWLHAAVAAPKVLLVVSSEGREAGKTRPGFERDELGKAWLTLRANGLAVDVASPTGGAPEADRYNPADDHIQRMQADARGRALRLEVAAVRTVRALSATLVAFGLLPLAPWRW